MWAFDPQIRAKDAGHAAPTEAFGRPEVEGVNAISDASAKGVRPGDVVPKAGDRSLSSLADLSDALTSAKQAGRKGVLVLIARDS